MLHENARSVHLYIWEMDSHCHRNRHRAHDRPGEGGDITSWEWAVSPRKGGKFLVDTGSNGSLLATKIDGQDGDDNTGS